MKTMNNLLAIAAVLLALSTGASAQTRVGSSYDYKGNDTAKGTRSDSASVAVGTTSDSILTKDLRCKLFGVQGTCARISLEAHSAGGSFARIQVAGKTLFYTSLSRSGTYQYGPTLLTLFSVPPVQVFTYYGIFTIKASGNAGAGGSFNGNWLLQALPPRADLIANAQTWGNATGKVTASLLAGAANLSTTAIVDFFNTKLKLNAYATKSGLSSSYASFQTLFWQLLVRFKATALWGYTTLLDKIIVNLTGPTYTYRWF
jgi:hypothetical protein